MLPLTTYGSENMGDSPTPKITIYYVINREKPVCFFLSCIL